MWFDLYNICHVEIVQGSFFLHWEFENHRTCNGGGGGGEVGVGVGLRGG